MTTAQEIAQLTKYLSQLNHDTMHMDSNNRQAYLQQRERLLTRIKLLEITEQQGDAIL